MSARLLPVAASLIVCAWFGIGVRANRDQADVSKLVAKHVSLTARQARTANAMLSQASFLNPDQMVDILRAQVAVRDGDARGALRIGEAVVRREPANYQGWFLVEEIGRYVAPTIAHLASAHLQALAPPVPKQPA